MATGATTSPALKAPPALAEFLTGWICVLEAEYRAALAVLDEKYDNAGLVRGEGDRNHYVLGRIGRHSVMINLPPAGWHGQVHASKIALDMRSTFPRMRFVLLVGIAGGVPSPQDIRLGDVVLGTQVFPYNTLKNTQYGHVHTGSIRSPPRELLEAITFLTQRLWSPEDLVLSESIEGIRSKLGRGGDAFVRPAQDRLYKDNTAHKGPDCDCLQPQSRERSQLFSREDRKGDLVKLFQGCIGSENVVMKNAQDRDDIAKKMNILCYEMEATSVMDTLPCLPIRGISDYADGHKNDDWHLYAALSAATCARELLLSLTPQLVTQFSLNIAGDFVDRYMKGAVGIPNVFSGSEIEKLRQARNSLMERHAFLEETVNMELRNSDGASPDNLDSMQDLVRKLTKSQQDLRIQLERLDRISEYHGDLRSSPDPGVRNRYRDLKSQLQRDKETIDGFSQMSEGMFEATGVMLGDVAVIIGRRPDLGVAGRVMTYLGEVMKLLRSSKVSPASLSQYVHRKVRGTKKSYRSDLEMGQVSIRREEDQPLMVSKERMVYSIKQS